jgi:hypothetical protein
VGGCSSVLATVLSDQVQAYTAKRFPGMIGMIMLFEHHRAIQLFENRFSMSIFTHL